jgi:hypothetical protein
MDSGYVRLWSQPYIWKERGGIRWPGVLSLHWNSWRRANLAINVQNLCDGDGEDKRPWLFHVHLIVIGLWLYFPGKRMPPIFEGKHRMYGENRQWGFSAYFTDHGALHLYWNAKTKVVWWPWAWTHMRTEARRADGSWVPYVGSWERDREPDGKEILTFDYTYVQRDGEVQKRIATVSVQRMFHRRRWTKWTSWGEKCWQYIDFNFNDEVGSETGSWKGGVIGSSETMLPGETAEQTLRRMERDRRFDR